VHRIPLPLPNDGLRAVNCYAIESRHGVVLIDPGWNIEQAWLDLEKSLETVGHDFGTVEHILVTHAHRDHLSLAEAFRRRFGTRISVGIGEDRSIAQLSKGSADGSRLHLVSWGGENLSEELDQILGSPSDAPERYGAPDTWIVGSVDIEIGTRKLRAIPTPGHTRGHLVYVDFESEVIFSGDHILPHITPAVGYEAVRSENPLGDFLESLQLVKDLPRLTLLPAHGPVGGNAGERAEELIAHHHHRLETTLARLRSGQRTPKEVASELLWTRNEVGYGDLDPYNQMLAISETVAHLDFLVSEGDALLTVINDVMYYEGAPSS
jgi:glyoxylase-like metal-dependent hydrolase (beta-lactamase superfamily II)